MGEFVLQSNFTIYTPSFYHALFVRGIWSTHGLLNEPITAKERYKGPLLFVDITEAMLVLGYCTVEYKQLDMFTKSV